MPEARRLTARLLRRAMTHELGLGTAAASAPATAVPARLETWSARGTRKASGATVLVAVADGPRRTKIEPWRGNAGVPAAWGRLRLGAGGKAGSSGPASMSLARWPFSWGMAEGVARRSARRWTSSPRRTSAEPASAARGRPLAAPSALGAAARGPVAHGG